jgi:uncharacterized protein (DUF2267 family)
MHTHDDRHADDRDAGDRHAGDGDAQDDRCQRILDQVDRAGLGVPPWQAVNAVLGTLGEVLPYGTAAYLAASLPDSVGAAVGRHFPADGAVGSVGRAEFETAVARRCGCAADEAGPVIRAVTEAVAGVVPLGVMVNVEHVTPEPLLDLIPHPA